jgi:hypothetical protein
LGAKAVEIGWIEPYWLEIGAVLVRMEAVILEGVQRLVVNVTICTGGSWIWRVRK